MFFPYIASRSCPSTNPYIYNWKFKIKSKSAPNRTRTHYTYTKFRQFLPHYYIYQMSKFGTSRARALTFSPTKTRIVRMLSLDERVILFLLYFSKYNNARAISTSWFIWHFIRMYVDHRCICVARRTHLSICDDEQKIKKKESNILLERP